MAGEIVKLVPKVAAKGDPTKEENAFAALHLALDTLKDYDATGAKQPDKVLVLMVSNNPDGSTHVEYVTANLGRLATLGLMETVKFDMLASGEA